MSDFWVSERGTDMLECGNRFAACVCNRETHSPTEPCTCNCGGSWHYDDNGDEVVDSLPTTDGIGILSDLLKDLL